MKTFNFFTQKIPLTLKPSFYPILKKQLLFKSLFIFSVSSWSVLIQL